MKLSSQIRGAVTQLVNAEIAEAFKGSGDPADYEIIEHKLRLARQRLEVLLKRVDQHI